MSLSAHPAQLPTLDFSRFHGSQSERDAFTGDLRQTLHDHGFFYLTGHGVDPKLIADVVAVAKRFFALPLEQKIEIEMVKSPQFSRLQPGRA